MGSEESKSEGLGSGGYSRGFRGWGQRGWSPGSWGRLAKGTIYYDVHYVQVSSDRKNGSSTAKLKLR